MKSKKTSFIRNFIKFFLYPFSLYLKASFNLWYLDETADKQYYKVYDSAGTEVFLVSTKVTRD